MKSRSIQARTTSAIVFGSLLVAVSNTFAFAPRTPFGLGSSAVNDNYYLTNNGERTSFARNDFVLFAGKQRQNNRGRQPAVPKPPMNEELDPIEFRVTVPNPPGKDEPLGVLHRDAALAKAKEMGGLDLILVNPNSDPPVCKIVDYSKYRYMQEKKAKEVKKNSKASEIKEVKMSYKIDIHDYDVRKKNALKFLNQGNRVKCTVMFRGREVTHDKLGFELLDKIAADLDSVCVREGRAKREGRNLSLIISPRPEVLKKINEYRRAEEKARKKLKAEKKGQKAAAAAGGVNGAAAAIATMDDDDDFDDDYDDDDDDDDDDLDSDIESSLDDLFGNDGLSDDLFN